MNKDINWQAITAPLDYKSIYVPPTFLRRWMSYERVESGVLFHCQMADGRPVEFRLDIVAPDIIRVRMHPEQIRHVRSDMLVRPDQDWPAQPFGMNEHDDCLTITTDRLRVEFSAYPWQMRVAARSGRWPFFSQRIDDRAYGAGYETPPIGFDQAADGRLLARESVAVRPGEAFYGLGEKFTPLNKWGQEITSYAMDCGNVSSHRSYKNIPFLMSTAGYGVFVHSSYPIVYRMGAESSITYSIHIADSLLDYFLIYGPEFKRILQRYTDLTGRAPMPPKWSFGFWMSRAGYKNRREVEGVIQEMRTRDFPCDVIHLDPWWMGNGPWSTYEWDTASFPQPEEMICRLREQGVRTCLWIHPYVPVGTRIYQEGLEKGYFVRRPDGQPAPVVETFSGSNLVAIDFTNPEARAWLLARLDALHDMGVAVFKTDFGEQAPVDAVYYDGRSGLEMHNLYPLLYNRAVFELSEKRFGRGLVWGRSAYAGSQRYPVQWGGDSYSSLDQIACQLKGLLSYGISGVPFCSHDVGGFDYSPAAFDYLDRNATEAGAGGEFPKDPVTYIRWLQFGVFSSHIRAHGKQPREPWSYGPEAEAIARRYLKLRYRLLPYIYSQAVRSTQTGLPMARPLVLEYQDDPNTYNLDTEYLFGDSFLVAPVLTPDNHCRVYLPAGQWVNYWTKELCDGGRWIEADAPLEVLPLWVKAGAIIPLGPEMDYVEQKPLDPLVLELYYPQGEGETIIYDEDKPEIAVRYRRRGNTLTVEAGKTPGQVEIAIYGMAVTQAVQRRKPVQLHACPGGNLVRLDGANGNVITFKSARRRVR